MRLRKQFGEGRWRKLKGHAKVRLQNGMIRDVEIHWYEAHGKKKMKIIFDFLKVKIHFVF